MPEYRNAAMIFANISDLVNYDTFETIKDFILKQGHRMTYRNYDNNNPHYQFEGFNVFLGADIGQGNINNDPEISDFNQLTIADWESDICYYNLIIVRKGDLKPRKAWILPAMKEGEVYLVDYYEKRLDTMRNNLPTYLEVIKNKLNSHFPPFDH